METSNAPNTPPATDKVVKSWVKFDPWPFAEGDLHVQGHDVWASTDDESSRYSPNWPCQVVLAAEYPYLIEFTDGTYGSAQRSWTPSPTLALASE